MAQPAEQSPRPTPLDQIPQTEALSLLPETWNTPIDNQVRSDATHLKSQIAIIEQELDTDKLFFYANPHGDHRLVYSQVNGLPKTYKMLRSSSEKDISLEKLYLVQAEDVVGNSFAKLLDLQTEEKFTSRYKGSQQDSSITISPRLANEDRERYVLIKCDDQTVAHITNDGLLIMSSGGSTSYDLETCRKHSHLIIELFSQYSQRELEFNIPSQMTLTHGKSTDPNVSPETSVELFDANDATQLHEHSSQDPNSTNSEEDQSEQILSQETPADYRNIVASRLLSPLIRYGIEDHISTEGLESLLATIEEADDETFPQVSLIKEEIDAHTEKATIKIHVSEKPNDIISLVYDGKDDHDRMVFEENDPTHQLTQVLRLLHPELKVDLKDPVAAIIKTTDNQKTITYQDVSGNIVTMYQSAPEEGKPTYGFITDPNGSKSVCKPTDFWYQVIADVFDVSANNGNQIIDQNTQKVEIKNRRNKDKEKDFSATQLTENVTFLTTSQFEEILRTAMYTQFSNREFKGPLTTTNHISRKTLENMFLQYAKSTTNSQSQSPFTVESISVSQDDAQKCKIVISLPYASNGSNRVTIHLDPNDQSKPIQLDAGTKTIETTEKLPTGITNPFGRRTTTVSKVVTITPHQIIAEQLLESLTTDDTSFPKNESEYKRDVNRRVQKYFTAKKLGLYPTPQLYYWHNQSKSLQLTDGQRSNQMGSEPVTNKLNTSKVTLQYKPSANITQLATFSKRAVTKNGESKQVWFLEVYGQEKVEKEVTIGGQKWEGKVNANVTRGIEITDPITIAMLDSTCGKDLPLLDENIVKTIGNTVDTLRAETKKEKDPLETTLLWQQNVSDASTVQANAPSKQMPLPTSDNKATEESDPNIQAVILLANQLRIQTTNALQIKQIVEDAEDAYDAIYDLTEVLRKNNISPESSQGEQLLKFAKIYATSYFE